MRKKLLTDRQKVFAEHYARTLNGAASAEAAGYSARTSRSQASQMLSRSHVAAYVDELAAENREKNEVEVAEVIEGLRKIAFAPASAKISNSDRIAALTQLGRTLGMFSDKTINQVIEAPFVIDDIDATIAECKAAKDAISRNNLKLFKEQ